MSNPAEINVALCKLLGLDSKNVQSIDVRLRPMAFPEVDVTYRGPIGPDMAQEPVIARYELRPRDDAQTTAPT